MTEQEKIEMLKKNKEAFGLMDEELREKAKEIGKKHFGLLLDNLVWDFDVTQRNDFFYNASTYRLKPDYHELESKPKQCKDCKYWKQAIGLRNSCKWSQCTYKDKPCKDCSAFEPAEEEPEEFKLCKIEPQGRHYYFIREGSPYLLHEAPSQKGFSGYLFNNGLIYPTPILHLDKDIELSFRHGIMLSELESRQVKVLYATHVVYRKG